MEVLAKAWQPIGIVPPLYRLFCDWAIRCTKDISLHSLNARTVGNLYAGAVELIGAGFYFDKAIRSARKRDAQFGPVVFFGMGGIHMETFRDLANTLCPADPASVEKRFSRLKIYSLLEGARGQTTGDVAAFVDLVVQVSRIMVAHPEIRELDMNPVRVFEKGALPLDIRMLVA